MPEPCEKCGIPIQNIRLDSRIGFIAVIDMKRPPGPCWYDVIQTSPTSWEYDWHSPERCRGFLEVQWKADGGPPLIIRP